MRQGSALGILDVLQQAASGAKSARRVFNAKANQIAGTKLQIQLLTCSINFKFPQRATT